VFGTGGYIPIMGEKAPTERHRGNAAYNRGGGVTVSSTGARVPMGGGDVFQAMAGPGPRDAMLEQLALEDHSIQRDHAERRLLQDEQEGGSVREFRGAQGQNLRDRVTLDRDLGTRAADLADRAQGFTESFSKQEADRNHELRQIALSQEWSKIRTAEDAQRWTQKHMESERLMRSEQMKFEREEARSNGVAQRDALRADTRRQDTAQDYQIGQARRAEDSEARRELVAEFQADEDLFAVLNGGEWTAEAAMKLTLLRDKDSRFSPIIDSILSSPEVQRNARLAGHSLWRRRDVDTLSSNPAAYFMDTDREREAPAQNRFNARAGIPGPGRSPANDRLQRRGGPALGPDGSVMHNLSPAMAETIRRILLGSEGK
jgi:hypothetical protein